MVKGAKDSGAIKRFILKAILLIGLPFTLFSAIWLYWVRKKGILDIEDKILMRVGMLPLIDHYYQPLVNPRKYLFKSLREDRDLPGIDMNVQEQLSQLSKFNYNEELLAIPLEKTDRLEYYYNCDPFCSGDAEYFYSTIRYFKPRMIVEIGSGASTLMAFNALRQNKNDDNSYRCRHICIEPYEQPWLEANGVEVIRMRVEMMDKSLFNELKANDILFIDSSHMIRTQGDVLFEYLEVLPSLNPGVLIHVHDIFSPKDYLTEWVNTHNLWNEQYLLEALLSGSNSFKIIGALNYLSHHYSKEFDEKCPVFAKRRDHEPGSFWIVKT
ncbi:MAG TPA: class I SAM-dependent methyltransferase [Cyclobacteriaceae bacterium]|jgi:predicted O-methyltransferase YrrM|nr:class I SAM-dependent methyltransferase [Cyclobacteriaceae bacterium]